MSLGVLGHKAWLVRIFYGETCDVTWGPKFATTKHDNVKSFMLRHHLTWHRGDRHWPETTPKLACFYALACNIACYSSLAWPDFWAKKCVMDNPNPEFRLNSISARKIDDATFGA